MSLDCSTIDNVDVFKIPVITISYNAPDLIQSLLASFRRFYPNPCYIIDGSEPSQLGEITRIAAAFDNVQLIGFGYNIHHGPGMAWAIANLPLSGPVLFLDSDILVVNGGFIESMLTVLKPGMYGVGSVGYVNSIGQTTALSEDAIRHLHPACMLCNIEVMRAWPLPIKHGAPMIATMSALKDASQSRLIQGVDWIGNDFEKGSDKIFLEHDWQGTVVRTGGYHLDIQDAKPPAMLEVTDNSAKPAGYNHDLLSLIPRDSTNLIEIGCKNGNIAAAYKRTNSSCDFVGVEIDASAAQLAEKNCDTAWHLDIEAADEQFFERMSDRTCWIFGDVLEHLRDPWLLLSKIRRVIPANGCIVASIPNAQHWTMQAKLSIGDFRYESGGLFDRTHLRWFTRATIFEMFQSAGFVIAEGYPRVFDEPARAAVLPVIKLMAETVGADGDLAVQDSIPLQYVVRAIPV